MVCGKKKKSMNNVTIYAIELSNSNFFQPSRLTRCSTHPITCRPRIEWLHNFKQIAHQTRYKKWKGSWVWTEAVVQQTSWRGFMQLKRWRARPGRELLYHVSDENGWAIIIITITTIMQANTNISSQGW